jgi:hypothetical protein
MTESPTTDIAELFSRDPHKHSDLDIDTIVEHLRKSRASFKLGNISAGTMKVNPKQKEVASFADSLNLDLDL